MRPASSPADAEGLTPRAAGDPSQASAVGLTCLVEGETSSGPRSGSTPPVPPARIGYPLGALGNREQRARPHRRRHRRAAAPPAVSGAVVPVLGQQPPPATVTEPHQHPPLRRSGQRPRRRSLPFPVARYAEPAVDSHAPTIDSSRLRLNRDHASFAATPRPSVLRFCLVPEYVGCLHSGEGTMAGPVVLKKLLRDRHWQVYRTFCVEYDKAARGIDRTLLGTYPSRAQLHRWLAGDLKRLPHPHHCQVLEAMLPGMRAHEMFEPLTAQPLPTDLAQAVPSHESQTDLRMLVATGLSAPAVRLGGWRPEQLAPATTQCHLA